MNLNVMKFKDYIWPHNPSTLEIAVKRDIKEVMIPFRGSMMQDYGREKRVVSGRGQFFGEGCADQYGTLFSVFKQGGSGYLSLPGLESFLAVFKALELTGTYLPNSVSYSFEFWEDLTQSTASLTAQEDFYTVPEGDTLWSIAARFEVPVEQLLSLNRNIKSPNQLELGERVRLR
mgnify:FL=1